MTYTGAYTGIKKLNLQQWKDLGAVDELIGGGVYKDLAPVPDVANEMINGEVPAFHIQYKKQIIQGALLLTLIAMVYFLVKGW